MKVDIAKLEKLGCLQLSEDIKSKVTEGLNSAIDLMLEIQNAEVPVLDCQPIIVQSVASTSIRNIAVDTTVNKQEDVDGVHLEQGYFLSPKVIKK